MQQCVICILDILGTKGVWTEQNVETYFDLIGQVEESLAAAKIHFEGLVKGSPLKFDYITFSDTLILTIINENKYDYFFDEVIGSFSQLVLGIFQQYFASNLFLRGAISYGDIEKRGNHFVGPAVDDAAEYFELQDMIGVCLTPKASIRAQYSIDWNLKYMNKRVDDFMIKYKTPLKTNKEVELFQINWVDHFLDRKDESPMDPYSSFCGFLSHRNIPLIALSKFTNTLAFFKYVEALRRPITEK